MRYLWDMHYEYLKSAGRLTRLVFPIFAHWLRVWDRASADRVDAFIANSTFVASRLRKFYRREAQVVFPPVDTMNFSHTRARDDFYLLLGQLVPYKRPDLAIEAFNRMGLPLVVIGEGKLLRDLRTTAGPNIKLLGRQPFDVVKDHMERCKALVFPGVEDFGIVPVEAMAAGAPVIAYGRGGVLDTVIDGETGVLFSAQTSSALESAVLRIERGLASFDREALRSRALEFDKSVFMRNIADAIRRAQVSS